jgi:hypothetical protein
MRYRGTRTTDISRNHQAHLRFECREAPLIERRAAEPGRQERGAGIWREARGEEAILASATAPAGERRLEGREHQFVQLEEAA